MTTAWTRDDVKVLARQDISRLPVLSADQVTRPDADLYYWDMWPVQDRDGAIADIRGREFWMILTAPDNGDPEARHFAAKIHLLERLGESWRDLGTLLPDFGGPYEREWSGSAIWDGQRFTLWFTGAGLRERPGGYQQALFETTASIDEQGLPTGWARPQQILAALSDDYIPADAHEGEAGLIKAYRDPAYFRDPKDGAEFLVITASRPAPGSDYTGAIGFARKTGGQWQLLAPLIHAGGVNNEMERAHIVFHDGRYFAFWVTQSSTFAPGLENAPTGLYGMVADQLEGPYLPLNGSGLVVANPVDRPFQAYSWSVTRELLVSSFVASMNADCSDFAGAPAPLVKLTLDAGRKRAWLETFGAKG